MAYETKTTQFKIFNELDDQKVAYETGSLEKIGGLKRSQYQVIRMCEFYSDSRYMGAYIGNTKKVGSGQIDVPFYNIVNFRVALAKTATDLDIKDIQIQSDDPEHQVHSMLLNREAYEWMKKSGFAMTLNQMGQTRPKYGGYLVKKNEYDGLKIDVVKWTNVITDQNNILDGSIDECHRMSPVAINRKVKVWNNTTEVLKAHRKIKAKERPSTIDVYEMTGEYPVSIYKNAKGEAATAEDEYIFSLQHYFVAVVDGKKFLMYCEELSGEMTDYYECLPWEDNGYGLGRGVIEDSEEAQVWTNDAVINESIAMTLAGRVGIKTTSKKVAGNVLEHDHGKIYELEANTDMGAFNLAPAALGQYQNQIEKWRSQADNVTSSYNSITGEQPPSGTPYSQTALLNQVATKPFDYKREEWGNHLTKLFEKWVIPYLIKKIKKEHILVSEFSEEELELIDDSFAYSYADDFQKEENLKGLVVSPLAKDEMIQTYKNHIKKLGKKRFIEVPDDYFDDIVAKVTVITTGEQKNKAAILMSLSEIMNTVIKSYNPNTGTFGVLTDKTLSKIFKQIVEIAGAGISPISLGVGNMDTKQVAQAPSEPVQPLPSPMDAPLSTAALTT